MNPRWKNIMIGTFVLVAFAIGVVLILFLKPQFGDGKKTLNVRFANISGINKGTRVTYAGRPIGEVVRIEEIANARLEAADESGRVYYYQLLLRIDSKIMVYTSDEIAICSTGLMGEKSVAILPKAPAPGSAPKQITDQMIYANSNDPIESTFNQIGRVAAKAERTIDRVDDWIKQSGPTLANAAKGLSDATQSLNTVLASVNQQNLIPALKETLDVTNDNMRLLRSAFNDDQLLSRLATLIKELNEAAVVFNTDGAKVIGNLSQITHDLSTGSGTLGHLIAGDDFYLRINSLMSKSETLMNDINHYGLLFQYNKQWQKSRTKKANLMNSLDSPKEFKEFFEGEIDGISTSLGRISEMLDRADQDNQRDKILMNDAFKRDFTILLRQSKALNDSLRLFNQDLTAKSEGK